MQQRGEDFPAGIKLIVTNKVGVVTFEGIEDKGLVRLGDFEVRETASVGEIKLGGNGLHAQARELGVHLDVH